MTKEAVNFTHLDYKFKGSKIWQVEIVDLNTGEDVGLLLRKFGVDTIRLNEDLVRNPKIPSDKSELEKTI